FFTASVITEINTLSLPDALPISTTLGRTAAVVRQRRHVGNTGDLDAQGIERTDRGFTTGAGALDLDVERLDAVFHRRAASLLGRDRKSTRLNSSHVKISYAVFCL